MDKELMLTLMNSDTSFATEVTRNKVMAAHDNIVVSEIDNKELAKLTATDNVLVGEIHRPKCLISDSYPFNPIGIGTYPNSPKIIKTGPCKSPDKNATSIAVANKLILDYYSQWATPASHHCIGTFPKLTHDIHGIHLHSGITMLSLCRT